MKKFLKGMGYAIGGLVLILVGLLGYIVLALPKVKPADQTLKIEATPARLARGKYLAEHVAACMGCHSQRDFNIYGHPIKPGLYGAGGEPLFKRPIVPGVVQPKNLTPYHLKDWSDGELVRAIRTGVSKDGRPLFPMMPYPSFAEMEQEDLYSVIAYIRSIPEVKNDVTPTKLDPPLNIIVHTIPKDAPDYPKPVDRKDRLAYGHYLVKMSGCADCHTPVDDKHEPLPGMFLAGGQEFPYFNSKMDLHPGGGKLRVPNITPDAETGIGGWTQAQFIDRFAQFRGKRGQALIKPVDLEKGDYIPVMPYLEYSGMTDEDLGSIYQYLRTIPAVKRQVVRFDPPKI